MSGHDVVVPDQLRAGFLAEAQGRLGLLRKLWRQYATDPTVTCHLDTVARDVKDLKDNLAFFGCMKGRLLAHELERHLDGLGRGSRASVPANLGLCAEVLEALEAALQRVDRGGPEVADPPAFAALVARLREAERAAGAAASELFDSLIQRLTQVRDGLTPTTGRLSLIGGEGARLRSLLESVMADCGRLAAAPPSPGSSAPSAAPAAPAPSAPTAPSVPSEVVRRLQAMGEELLGVSAALASVRTPADRGA